MTCFEGTFCLPGFKGKAWATLPDVLFCLGSHVRPEEPVTCKRLSMCSRPKWPTCHCGILWRATSLCAAGRTNWRRASSRLPGPGPSGTRHLVWATDGYTPTCTDWLWVGLWALDWPFPSVPSHSLVMTKLRTGSALLGHYASPVRSYRQPPDCPGLHPGHADHNCRPLWGLQRPLEGSLLYSSHCCSCDPSGECLELSGMHPSQDTLDKASTSILVFPAR